MSAPYAGASLEEHLNRLESLLRTIENAFDHANDDDEVMEGAEVCLGYAVDLVDRMQVGLPARALNAEVKEQ